MAPKAPASRPPQPPPASTTPPNPSEAEAMPWLEELPPRKIVAELDRYIVGQEAAKKAVAIAVRNRWRRAQAPEEIRDEIMPNNIIMIGPTGVGKTEIARRLARLAISVLPTPVGPIMMMLFGMISSRISSGACARRQRLRTAMATAFFAASWPTM